ncbi:class I SAM-dependent methyltransferase [Candidatus Pacearchaeota archaeon]|nr:class I SAM-dependent methyltransferase [Candidatus Pacearchaeota archaeon]
MINTIPKITQNFIEMINEKANGGTYRVKLGKINIDVFPYIFPPQSPFSESTHSVYQLFGNLAGQEILDVGTGTGIQAIYAALAGAKRVDAVDIYGPAVRCAKHNVALNGLEKVVKVWQSNLFRQVPKKEYDLIIANLPIIDAQSEDIKLHSLVDPGFLYHEELFREAPSYLSKEGSITLCHANLHEGSTFERLENAARHNSFLPNIKKSLKSLGYEWRSYEFRSIK